MQPLGCDSIDQTGSTAKREARMWMQAHPGRLECCLASAIARRERPAESTFLSQIARHMCISVKAVETHVSKAPALLWLSMECDGGT